MCRKAWIIVVLVMLLLPKAQASDEELTDVEIGNLRWSWEVYDEELGYYVPFFKQDEVDVIRFELDLNKYRNANLRMSVAANYFVWIEDEIVFTNPNSTKVYFDLDSLQTIYRQNKIYITIYSPYFNEKDLSTLIVNRRQVDISTSKVEARQKREINDRRDLFILISILTLSLVAVLRTFNFRLFQEYFSLGKALQLRQNFDLITAHAPIAWPNIGFIVFYAILMGSGIMNVDLFRKTSELLPNLPSGTSVLIGLKVGAICFALMLLKLLIVLISAELFKIRKIRHLHFFTYFRLSLIIAIVVFSLSVINGVFGGSLVTNGWEIVQRAVLVVLSMRLILIFFVLNKIYTFRKLHLFSYLCSTELIPLLLFLKVFLK